MRTVVYLSNELYHHGIKGQRWGVRRYQNADGTLTAAGRRRYEVQEAKNEYKAAKSEYRQNAKTLSKSGLSKNPINNYKSAKEKYGESFANMVDAKAKYAASKYDSPSKKAKAEKRVYTQALFFAGQKWSTKDVSNYGAGGSLQDRLIRNKGQDYVKSCQKTINTTTISALAAGTAVAAGAAALTILNASKALR